jgi:hypothetical protein
MSSYKHKTNISLDQSAGAINVGKPVKLSLRDSKDIMRSCYRCAWCLDSLPKGEANSCARCRIVRYCSKQCQISHWKARHKNQCKHTDGSANNPTGLDRKQHMKLCVKVHRWWLENSDNQEIIDLVGSYIRNCPSDKVTTACMPSNDRELIRLNYTLKESCFTKCNLRLGVSKNKSVIILSEITDKRFK